MQICLPCKKEMQCVFMGVQVRYGDGTHAYAGDTFECPSCGTKVIVTNGTPGYDPTILVAPDKELIDSERNVWMDKGKNNGNNS